MKLQASNEPFSLTTGVRFGFCHKVLSAIFFFGEEDILAVL